MTTNLYLDINPITKKPFYVGIGTMNRCYLKTRKNIYHKNLVGTFPEKIFNRIILYKNIPLEQAYKIERQIIKRCGKIIDGSGILTNIHNGGPLENFSEFGHPYRGKKMIDIYGENWKHPNTGKPYLYMYDEMEKTLVLQLQKLRREKSRKVRLETIGKTEKEKTVGEKRKKRIKEVGYTKNELNAHKKASERQLGLSMKDRLNNPEWIHPFKGKSFLEIHGENYIHPKKGKTMKYFKGDSYIDPKVKPFRLIINNNEVRVFESEKDFTIKTNLSSTILCKIKKNGSIIIKRQSNSRHNFKTGDILKYVSITLDEYKKSLIDKIFLKTK